MSAPQGAPQNIVVGFDGSKDSKAALRWAARLSGAMGARLRIVHAVGLLEHAGLSDHAAVHRETALQLVTDAGLRSADVEWTVVDGDPCSALLGMTIGPESADLIVVGSRGSNAHAGSLLGSTSLELAQHTAVPVLIVPAESGTGEPAPV
jgi:nucleotide-binding universal stress UspA family protein